MATTGIAILTPEPLAPSSSGLVSSEHHIDWHYLPESFQQNSPVTTDGTDGNLETKNWDWLENSNSSVSLAGQKLAQLIGNRQKLETGVTRENFSR